MRLLRQFKERISGRADIELVRAVFLYLHRSEILLSTIESKLKVASYNCLLVSLALFYTANHISRLLQAPDCKRLRR